VHAQWVRNGLWRGSFLVNNPHVCGGFSDGLFASNTTQMTVISGWNGSYGSMRPRGHDKHLAIGDRGHAKWANGSKTVAGGGPFWPETPMPMSEGGSAARSWPPMLMSLKGLQFPVGMVHMDRWDPGDRSDS